MNDVKRIDLQPHTWTDHRGWVTNPIEAANIQNALPGSIHIATLNPGSIRGNHFHPKSKEWLLIFGGPARFYWRSCKEAAPHEVIIRDSGPVLFEIPPGIEHAVVNPTQHDVYLMAFSDSNDRDTVKTSLIQLTDDGR